MHSLINFIDFVAMRPLQDIQLKKYNKYSI